MNIRDRLRRLEVLHPPPVDIDKWARDRVLLLFAMRDTVGGPVPRTEAEIEAEVEKLASLMRAKAASSGGTAFSR